jgi:prepilin-type N-terminal cleavage/methylation domain-containing protein
MMQSLLEKSGQRGFTLIEVIVTIIAAAIVGVIFINYMGTAMSKSALIVNYVDSEASAEAKLEEIIADYVAEINKSSPTAALATLKGKSYGPLVTMQYIRFNISGSTATEEVLTTETSNTLKVTVGWSPDLNAEGRSLSTLLTTSRLPGSPTVTF